MPANDLHGVLAEELDEALSLLGDYRNETTPTNVAEPFPSLLGLCEELCAEIQPQEPVRGFYHLACTGGTLMSKCLAALPNTILLSEIDPLSSLGRARPGKKPKFMPTDLLNALNHSTRAVDDNVKLGVFRAAIDSILSDLSKKGIKLVLRVHAHSQFCTSIEASSRPSVHDMLKSSFPLRPLVSVRHPLDSFLALRANEWEHFQPFCLEEYSKRTIEFLDYHRECEIIRYEDFVADPEKALAKMCSVLDLPFEPLVLDMFDAIRISGDSGRSGSLIKERPRRPVPQVIEDERTVGPYQALCARLGYEP
ncbi:hypothetical protein [Nioella sediminis]|jgi:hypothetical protein|uniref:hypothetical protein n=1 Tax=Nioella sediminis TaxID=1912092 RepID=UPI0008FD1DDE|nr:hypothetical protein [Nioella sediminis]TBX15105.1 hypothetical protein TK43_18960 [Roseovarius sp. JS7-11]